MPDLRRQNCQICRRHTSEVGPISWRGRCEPCGKLRFEQNCNDLHYHRGPGFDLWRQGMAASVGATIPKE